MIVVLTGGDASGKATQSKILAKRLGATLFSFPNYGSTVGKAILGNLQGSWEIHRDSNADHHEGCYKVPEVNALVLQSLMNTNRIERMGDLKAAAARGHVVLDRFEIDALVYGALDGLEPAWLEGINAQLPVKPDLYILLDVPVDEGFKRRPQRRDRYESSVKRMEDVRVAYLKMFNEKQQERVEAVGSHAVRELPGPIWRVVDGIGTIEEVSARVREAVGL